MVHWSGMVPLLGTSEAVTLAFGVALVLAALVYLYGEVRALRTHHHSFAVDPDESRSMQLVRRALSWFFIVFGLVVGSFFAFLALAV